MTRLPTVSGAEAVRAFEKAGWVVARQRGSHVVLTKQGKRANLSVPLRKQLDLGTLRGLIRDAGISVSEFIGLL
ncbi:MAG: type II toxin-antitoxin system HicA family toxin [Armatimonadetes bacterium]|nr:type II toxin-antitoxin system HicA family toxin [Armatimonadota bacterium]